MRRSNSSAGKSAFHSSGLVAASFNNVLDGNNGSDTIDGFLGNDTMDGGGSGGDILSYGLDRAVMVATAEVQPSG